MGVDHFQLGLPSRPTRTYSNSHHIVHYFISYFLHIGKIQNLEREGYLVSQPLDAITAFIHQIYHSHARVVPSLSIIAS